MVAQDRFAEPSLTEKKRKLVIQFAQKAWSTAQKCDAKFTAMSQVQRDRFYDQIGFVERAIAVLQPVCGPPATPKKMWELFGRLAEKKSRAEEPEPLLAMAAVLLHWMNLEGLRGKAGTSMAEALQTLAHAALLQHQPWVLQTTTSHFCQVTGCSNTKPRHLISEPHRLMLGLFAFIFNGRWRFMAMTYTDIDRPQELNRLQIPSWCGVKTPQYYMPYTRVCMTRKGDTCHVEEGCAIVVNYVHNLLPAFLWQQSALLNIEGGDVETAAARAVLKEILMLPDTPQNREWLLSKLKHPEAFAMITRKCLGLTHPEIPFLESEEAVVVDDEATVDQILDYASATLGVKLGDGVQWAFLPVSFATPLSDVDRTLQHAYVREAMAAPGSKASTAAAVRAAAAEALGESISSLAEVEESDAKQMLETASSAVRAAMTELHAVERRQKVLKSAAETAVLHALERALAEIGSKEKLRQEWARREHWVFKQSFMKQGPKKGKNRVRSSQPETLETGAKPKPACAKQLFATTVARLEHCTAKYQRTASLMAKLHVSGLLALDGAGANPAAQQENNDLEFAFAAGNFEVVPPKEANPDWFTSAPAVHSPARAKRRSQAFVEAEARDKELILARYNENAFKLGVEMSLADASNNMDGSSQARDAECFASYCSRTASSVCNDVSTC
eukprot:gb/GFBE01025505.1/.p1 GENE.gb/GFBE01025505.1/~~gb/GFBE01025505.1/.p1  ORF type:complete len:674 (+),score=136.58 gb/GFBE01025505.1/:1-2022(+)